jgi:A-factor type gamma-butyrolactone 1'-reductase (1S-forming)
MEPYPMNPLALRIPAAPPGPLLQDKVCLILGASRGIGAAAAVQFVHHGARVVVASRNRQRLSELVHTLGGDSGRVSAFQLDVDDPVAVQAAVDFTVDRYGRLDAAFNNAASNAPRKKLGDLSLEEFDAIIDTNLRAVFVAMRAEINAMLKTGGGSIVNTSSSAAFVGFPNMAGYVASKSGVMGLTKTAALDYAQQNIRVNAVAPGATLTEMLLAGSGATEQGRARIAAFTPMNRIADPSEIATAVAWLASDQASFVTGVTLPVDGGYIVP